RQTSPPIRCVIRGGGAEPPGVGQSLIAGMGGSCNREDNLSSRKRTSLETRVNDSHPRRTGSTARGRPPQPSGHSGSTATARNTPAPPKDPSATAVESPLKPPS